MPNFRAVSRSPSGGVISTLALSDWVINPKKLDIRLISNGLRPVGIKGKPAHSMPCCIANKLICCNTASLSPLSPPPAGLVPSCSEAGVIGVLPGIIGTIQANETIKLILGIGEVLKGRLLTFDALKMQFKELKLRKDDKCPVCSEHKVITELIDYEEFCGLKAADEKRI